MTNFDKKNTAFFLGGRDLEMERIRYILEGNGCEVFDKNLNWGAHASAYTEEILAAIVAGNKLVLVELDNQPHEATEKEPKKVPVDLPEDVILVDHHGEQAHRPASILQILALLGQESTRYDLLIAADDAAGGPVGLVSFGVTPEEFNIIRAEGRKAQGVTEKQEVEAARAIAAAERCGRLVIVRCAHSKCAPITDQLFPFWPDGKENVIIISDDGEVNYFGGGSVRAAIVESFPNGWHSSLEGNGYWGGKPGDRTDELIKLIKKLAG
ncbi:MAG: hypothetical protein QG614_136 [Patescibacteria group bacterium]|nr:hypothetical protein [Patescibacteria group bacterium]